MKIAKNIKFDCAHMLSGYEGKCANLHGHTYHGVVKLVAANSDDHTRMILDYNDIKKTIDMFDHAVILSSPVFRNAAEQELEDWAERYNMRMYVMPIEYPKTTAEDMACVIARSIHNLRPAGQEWTVTVVLSETDGSFAEATI